MSARGQPQRAVSIKDVAAAAGVSKSTVSRALLGQPDVSVAVREHVKRVAHELGYVKDLRAHALKMTQPTTIGLLVRSSALSFYGELFQGLQFSCARFGFRLATTTQANGQSQDEAVDQLVGLRPHAIVVASGRIDQQKLASISHRIPMVLVGPQSQFPSIGAVPHGTSGATHLANLVHELGHRNVAVLKAPRSHSSTISERAERMHARLQELGIAVRTVPIDAHDQPHPEGLLEAAQSVSAIMAPTDPVLISAWEILIEHGLEVPGDVSLVGHDGIGQLATPVLGLTTWRLPVADIAEAAISQLARRLRDTTLPAWSQMLEGTLVSGRTLTSVRDNGTRVSRDKSTTQLT